MCLCLCVLIWGEGGEGDGHVATMMLHLSPLSNDVILPVLQRLQIFTFHLLSDSIATVTTDQKLLKIDVNERVAT